jgi:hypothetical protein
VPDGLTESYDRLLLALEQLLEEAQRVGDAGVQEWASLAMLDAIDLGEEVGVMWDDEAERRRAAVREGFEDVDRRSSEAAARSGRLRTSPPRITQLLGRRALPGLSLLLAAFLGADRVGVRAAARLDDRFPAT